MKFINWKITIINESLLIHNHICYFHCRLIDYKLSPAQWLLRENMLNCYIMLHSLVYVYNNFQNVVKELEQLRYFLILKGYAPKGGELLQL